MKLGRGYVVIGLVLVSSVARAADDCEPTPTIRSALAVIEAQNQNQSLASLRALVTAHPDDVFVHEKYQDRAARDEFVATLAEYAALHQAKPNDARATYLYERLLTHSNLKEALPQLATLDFARAHLVLARRLKDREEQRRELAKYQAACPKALDAWPLRITFADGKARAAEVATLRRTLAARSDLEALALYAKLWRDEFQKTPVSAHPSLRQTVATDLVRLRAAYEVTPDPELLDTLGQGYQLTSNVDGLAWVKAHTTAVDSHAFMIEYMGWFKDHPAPKEPATKADRDAYEAAQFAASAAWTQHYPDNETAWEVRLSTAPRTLPNDQIKAIAAKLLALDDSSESVARAYLDHGVDIDNVPALVTRSLAKNERRWASERAQTDSPASSYTAMAESHGRFTAWDLLLRAYGALHDVPHLREIVAQMKVVCERDKPTDEEYLFHQANCWESRARLAAAEGRRADAIAYYVKTRAMMAGDYDEEEMRRVWKDFGGTDEGFAAMSPEPDKKPQDFSWQTKALTLPSLALQDLSGKTWRSSDWRGKTVVLVSWATWCAPCQAELPHLEELYQKTRNRKDVVVASLDIDQDVGLVEPFIKENHYTFPVLLSDGWANEARKNGVPLSWVADARFVVRLEMLGYNASSTTWVTEALAAIDRVAKSSPRK